MNWIEQGCRSAGEEGEGLTATPGRQKVRRYAIGTLLDKMTFGAICLFIFFLSIPHMTTIRLVLYGFAVVCGTVAIVKQRGQYPGLSIPFLPLMMFFCLWMLLGAVLSRNVGNSIHDLWVFWVKYVLLYVLMANFIREKRRIKICGWGVAGAGTLIAGDLLWQHFVVKEQGVMVKLVSDFSEMPVNWVGFFLCFSFAVTLTLLLRKRWGKGLLLFVPPLFLMGMTAFVTQSRATIFAFGSVGTYLLFRRNKMMGLVCVVCGVAALAVNPVVTRLNYTNIAQSDRHATLLVALEIWKENPVLGIGIGGANYTSLELDRYREKIPPELRSYPVLGDPHSLPLNLLVRTGVVGLVLFGILVFCVVWNLIQTIRRSGEDAYYKEWGDCFLISLFAVLLIATFEPTGNTLFAGAFFVLLGFITALFQTKRTAVVVAVIE